jgi:hypothetical protein
MILSVDLLFVGFPAPHAGLAGSLRLLDAPIAFRSISQPCGGQRSTAACLRPLHFSDLMTRGTPKNSIQTP